MALVSDLLATWEAGVGADAVHRSLLLCALARGGRPTDHLAVPLGARDLDLFGLRRRLFGEWLNGRVTCAGCGEELEFDFDLDNVLRLPVPGEEPRAVRVGERLVRFRLPTTGDLLAAVAAGSAEEARTVLLERCVLAVDGVSDPALTRSLAAELGDGVARAVAEADPGADVRLDLPCAECGQRTKASVDIASHLWAELDHWARATLLDVHQLASAYGWSEAEVLAVSPLRRRYYLELVGHG
ncbi:hypothetical protein LX15_002856 [Streptoalloteichus tenebrarius]|uniref:Phage baseplate protein n=1 Tax=Streptoalloteichus tenebrarius (strain ATCC 17920 / DSM 40477 / JCM 4838 / CBS 697.72 / NBRC 16177 / NCIMB 11028 / NRRL B-12390 / A12253. 1 / ISP 5477) TaxID=1933 RepID=A0ABT1HUF7_STRSD|nr:hypothetical protein [Streptoalloteichus tenebrarius]MCP2259155.1 hypothetical protein [Streptoalloteichus tenebrarius]BFF04368.1 hypothetical protein GCM10020241_60430 [Streptoalloteichus tenebrarius]